MTVLSVIVFQSDEEEHVFDDKFEGRSLRGERRVIG